MAAPQVRVKELTYICTFRETVTHHVPVKAADRQKAIHKAENKLYDDKDSYSCGGPVVFVDALAMGGED